MPRVTSERRVTRPLAPSPPLVAPSVPATNRKMFFYFFQGRTASGKPLGRAPLIAWFNGGPGCSSLYGLFFGEPHPLPCCCCCFFACCCCCDRVGWVGWAARSNARPRPTPRPPRAPPPPQRTGPTPSSPTSPSPKIPTPGPRWATPSTLISPSARVSPLTRCVGWRVRACGAPSPPPPHSPAPPHAHHLLKRTSAAPRRRTSTTPPPPSWTLRRPWQPSSSSSTAPPLTRPCSARARSTSPANRTRVRVGMGCGCGWAGGRMWGVRGWVDG